MRHRPQTHACSQGCEKTFDNPGPQFQRAFALAVRSHRSIAVPHNSHQPGRRHVFAGATGDPTVAHTIDHHFRPCDVQPLQRLANKFPLRFTEALANLALEGFEAVFISATAAPTLLNELQ